MTDVAEPAIAWEIDIEPGPIVAKGFDFTGCSGWSGPADSCACETWRPVLCDRCSEEIHDGQEYGTAETLSGPGAWPVPRGPAAVVPAGTVGGAREADVMGARPGTTWAASPDEASYAANTGKGWTVLVGACDRGLGRPTPMTRERAMWHLDRIRKDGRVDVALGLLWENRAPDGARWWEWLAVDDGWGQS